MPKLRTLKSVGADFASTGPNSSTLVQSLPVSAEVAFRSLKDPATWKAFLGIDVEWTSPEPFGVGTTRTVTANGQTIKEEFLTWEEGRHMGFRFSETTLPLKAFAEDWVLEPKTDDSCDLHWHYAYEWGGPLSALLSPLFGRFFNRNGRRALPKLAAYLASTDRYNQP